MAAEVINLERTIVITGDKDDFHGSGRKLTGQPKRLYRKDTVDVQSQINEPKELVATGHFCVQLRQSARKYSVDYPLHPTMFLSDIIGGGISTPWALVSPHKIFYLRIKKLGKPTPRNQENIGQLVCSRLVKIEHFTDGCPVKF